MISVRGILSHGGLRRGNPDSKVITGVYRSPGIAAESLPLFFKYLKGENGLYAGVGRPGEERGDKTLYEEMCLYSVRKK